MDTNGTYHFVQYSEVSLSQGLLMEPSLVDTSGTCMYHFVQFSEMSLSQLCMETNRLVSIKSLESALIDIFIIFLGNLFLPKDCGF